MAGENNIFLCVTFAIGIGLCFAISAAIPAWFAAKDREVEEWNNDICRNEDAQKKQQDECREEVNSEEEIIDVDSFDDINSEKGELFDEQEEAKTVINGEVGSWFAWFAEEYNNADIEAPEKHSKLQTQKDKSEEESIPNYEKLSEEGFTSQKDIQGSEGFLYDAYEEDAQPKVSDEIKKEKTSPRMWKIASFGSITFQFLGVVFNYFALLYGPVSICTPISNCSLILFNVIILSYALKIEKKPNKETRVGNYLLLAAAIQVVFTGPNVDSILPISNENLQAQLLAPLSATILLAIIGIFILTIPHILIIIFHEKGGNYFSDNFNFIAFQASMTTLGSLSANSLKVISNSEGWFFWVTAAVLAVCFLVFPVVSVYQNIVIKNPATFTSINAGLTYLMNVFVGLFCWEDQIINWGGYVLSWTMFLLGIYLVSDADLFEEKITENTEEDIDKNLTRVDEEPDARPNITRFSIVPGTRLESTLTRVNAVIAR